MSRSEAEKIADELQELAQGKLKQREDLVRIIEYGLKEEKKELLGKAAFDSKFICGLLKIVRRRDSIIDDELLCRYSSESSARITELKQLLLLILEGESEFITQIFKDKYFGMECQSVARLYELAGDLSWLKLYQNSGL